VVDYGYLIATRVDMQRTADHAVLAAVRDLAPDPDGSQDLGRVRETLRAYVRKNLGSEFVVLDSDIVIGRFDPETIYTQLQLRTDGILDTVGVTLRYDERANHSLSMYFARLLGIERESMRASAFAALQKARYLHEQSDILPIAVPIDVWNSQSTGDAWSIYGSGRITDSFGHWIPGNWGTVDIGAESNAASQLVDQINTGLRQIDLDILFENEIIPWPDKIDSQYPMWLNGDTGISSGMKDAIRNAHGSVKLLPLYDRLNDKGGGSLDFHIIGWGVVEVVDSEWNGNQRTRVIIRKSYKYDGDLRPHRSLANTKEVIVNAFTSPVLVK
jgi:hypothetical protein